MAEHRHFTRLDKAGKAARDALHARLSEAHPRTFTPYDTRSQGMRPLKIGIRQDLEALYPEVPAEIMQAFIARYTNSKWYLRASLVEGTARVDLNGEAADGITTAQAEMARVKLALKLERNARSGKQQPSAITAPPA